MEPQASRPSSARRPGFNESMVTVTSAMTQGPTASPVWAERPEGTSAATTRTPDALRQSIQMSNGARGSPRKPVPSMASSTTSAPAMSFSRSSRGGDTTTGTPARRALVATVRARSDLMSWGSTGVTTVTETSLPRSTSAATQPSPPLLPKPASTTTDSASPRFMTSWAAAAPALCMSSDRLTPASESCCSTSRTSSTFKTGCIATSLFPLARTREPL